APNTANHQNEYPFCRATTAGMNTNATHKTTSSTPRAVSIVPSTGETAGSNVHLPSHRRRQAEVAPRGPGAAAGGGAGGLDLGEDREVLDVTALLRPERAVLIDLLGGLEATDWDRPTECPAYTVKGVATHLLGDDLS